MALTAAVCSLYLATGLAELIFQRINLLSFPPEANYVPSNDHFKPHTSCLWPSNLAK